MSQINNKRINYIDFLRFLGLVCVIIAHVEPPNWMIFLRNFDVPLLVILSSIVNDISYTNNYDNSLSKCNNILKFYFNRIKRLIIPTWFFLFIYFLIKYLLGNSFTIDYYVKSFLLTRYGIGYVWIVLIYLYSALFVPYFSGKCFSKSILHIAVIYVIYEILCHYKLDSDNYIIDTTLYYMIPYGLLTFLGVNCLKINIKQKKIIILASYALFFLFGLYYWKKTGSIQNIQLFKYPPRVYYLSFGIGCSFLLLLLCEKCRHNSYLIDYVSKHSMWIYLWHIVALDICNYYGLTMPWFVKALLVFIMSIGAVFITNKIMDTIERYKLFSFAKYLR